MEPAWGSESALVPFLGQLSAPAPCPRACCARGPLGKSLGAAPLWKAMALLLWGVDVSISGTSRVLGVEQGGDMVAAWQQE